MTVVSGAEFNRNPSYVKREALKEPVIVTEREKPSLVVMSFEQYESLQGTPQNLGDWLQGEGEDDFEIPEVGLGLRSAEF